MCKFYTEELKKYVPYTEVHITYREVYILVFILIFRFLFILILIFINKFMFIHTFIVLLMLTVISVYLPRVDIAMIIVV